MLSRFAISNTRRVDGRGVGHEVTDGRRNNQSRIPGNVGGRGHRNSQHRQSRLSSPLASPPSPSSHRQDHVQQHSGINVKRHRQDVLWGDITILTTADLLYVGLVYVNFDKERQASVNLKENVERFREHYGVPPEAVVPLFNDLKDKYPTMSYKYALMTMHCE